MQDKPGEPNPSLQDTPGEPDPCLQDKPHLARAAYLRDFVYGEEHCPPVGGFPEDGLGQATQARITT